MRAGLVAALVLAAGCERSQPSATPTATATATTTSTATATATTTATTTSTATATATAEPKPKPYSGPTGSLSGTVRITGDPPPDTPHKYPPECTGEAAAMYGKLFRVGKERALADAVVAVSKYAGYVEPKSSVVRVTARGCAYSTRAIAMTDGQHIEVQNLEDNTTTYLPWLDGARLPAGIFATPHGDPVKLVTRGFQRYWLREQMGKTFMVAHVFHLHFATTAVTGLDGKYRIEGIPVGKVEASAMLPQANLLADPPGSAVDKPGKAIEIKAGENSADFELKFDKKRDVPAVSEDTLPDERPRE